MQKIILFLFFASLLFGTTYTVINNSDRGGGSLRQAIIDANIALGSDIIDFSAALEPASTTINLTTGSLPTIGETLTINGLAESTEMTINVTTTPIFNVVSTAFVQYKLNNLIMTNGFGNPDAGMISFTSSNGSLGITDSVIQDCSAQNSGGAIEFAAPTSSLTLTDNSFLRCEAITSSGGAILLASPRCGIRMYTKSFNFMISYKGEFNKYTKAHQVDGHFEWTF